MRCAGVNFFNNLLAISAAGHDGGSFPLGADPGPRNHRGHGPWGHGRAAWPHGVVAGPKMAREGNEHVPGDLEIPKRTPEGSKEAQGGVKKGPRKPLDWGHDGGPTRCLLPVPQDPLWAFTQRPLRSNLMGSEIPLRRPRRTASEPQAAPRRLHHGSQARIIS
eukprot:8512525-Pyramimonas_sp.AAC.1